MSVSSRSLVELVLLGPTSDRRQLQDSPVLGDVWIAFAAKPAEPMDLLITPYKARPAGPVAVLIAKRMRKLNLPREEGQEAQVAYLQGLVAARLFFREVLRIIVPMTQWWRDRKIQEGLRAYTSDKLRPRVQAIIEWMQAADEGTQTKLAEAFGGFTALDRYVSLAGIILWAAKHDGKATASGGRFGGLMPEIRGPDSDAIVAELQNLFAEILNDPFPEEAQVWQISLNRRAMPALERSVPAVKGDASRTLFNVQCKDITWAVLDSGIDGMHDVFKDKKGASRIIKAFDFSNIRKIVSLDNLNMKTVDLKQMLNQLLTSRKQDFTEKDAADLKTLAKDADNDRPINWGLVEKFIEIDPETPPRSGHGTHVAGIIGANGGVGNRAANSTDDTQADTGSISNCADGMCPDIRLYDFRVLAKSVEDTEFAIISALQYIRYLNERHTYITIHGTNLSLSIPHDVRNFACGRTPICNECEHLVASGVVVVTAAGNLGYQSFETREGSYEGYTAFSITDPGNADGVITVGATHRFRPHTYGVSFFSSRGPTGDGRLKPDLVAPGERIQSSLPGQGWGELDGTSMAAPHVSGAAAMLMARYTELIGEPRRIKLILCESATDLGRERTFQGHGMLDVLRAFQNV
jgi:serine protease AprX